MEKIYRKQWRGFVEAHNEGLFEGAKDPCRKLLEQHLENKLLGICIYRWKGNIFVYSEGLCEAPDPHDLLEPLSPTLSIWPGETEDSGPRRWIEMMDVFHFNEPAGREHWRRKAPVEERIGKLGVLKPEAVASYIYYHYGLQEERTFGGDKYEIIALHENLLFGYFERPEVVETPLYTPRLSTKSMPENWRDAKIPDHFIRWPDLPVSLRPIDLWLSVWE